MDIVKKHSLYNNSLFKRYVSIYDIIEIFIVHIRKKIADQPDLSKDSKILDVACGTGSQTVAFAKNGFYVVGIDLSPYMIEKAKKKTKNIDVSLLCKDAIDIPYEDSYFDLSHIALSLHDMHMEIGMAILEEMKRVTKKNGKIIIVDYNKPKNRIAAFLGSIPNIWESCYYNDFLKMGLENYLSKAGLTPNKIEHYFLGNLQITTCVNNK